MANHESLAIAVLAARVRDRLEQPCGVQFISTRQQTRSIQAFLADL